MDTALGASLPVFLGLTVGLFGLASFLAGQALARGWKPAWQILLFCLLLTAFDRFLVYALFDGDLLSRLGFAVHAIVLLAISTIAYRLTLAHKMVAQYPWLFERAGPFGWRERKSQ